MASVLNKHCCGAPEGAVYIGRGSKWGNPFIIGRDGDRTAVIAKHEQWLRSQRPLLVALDELRGKHLICFCAPAACHGDVLLLLANASRDERIAWCRGCPPDTPPATNAIGEESDPAASPSEQKDA